MGTPMSGHLVDAGYAVTVFDIDSGTSAALATAKPAVTVASSPAELAAGSDVVFTMLPDGYVVRDVAVGPDGLVQGLAPGSLLVDTSSSQPWITAETAEELRAAGVAMVDAPVSGAQWGAQAAELVFMVGGADDDVARARPMLDVLGRASARAARSSEGKACDDVSDATRAPPGDGRRRRRSSRRTPG